MDRQIEHKLTYDDVLLKPVMSYIPTRSAEVISLATCLGNKNLRIPIVSANMDTITETDMATTMHNLGGLGIIHRFMSPEDSIKMIETLHSRNVKHIAAAMGVNKGSIDRGKALIEAGADIICVDIAHGWCLAMKDTLTQLRKYLNQRGMEHVTLIAGNVASYDATLALLEWGASVVKIGVGPGSLCTTRIRAGVGVPQLSAVMSAKNAVDRFNLDKRLNGRQRASIIADGGIRFGGDVVKSLAAGADAVMIGSLFAGTDETPGEVIQLSPDHVDRDGTIVIHGERGKKHRGMASVDAQKDWKAGQNDEDYYEEGAVTIVPCQGSVVKVVKKLCNGVRSGCAYMNARSLKELRRNSVHRFVRVTPLGYSENMPHLLERNNAVY